MLFCRVLKTVFVFSIFCLKAIANEPPTETGSHIPEIETPLSGIYIHFRPISIPGIPGIGLEMNKLDDTHKAEKQRAIKKAIEEAIKEHEIHLRNLKELIEIQKEITDE